MTSLFVWQWKSIHHYQSSNPKSHACKECTLPTEHRTLRPSIYLHTHMISPPTPPTHPRCMSTKEKSGMIRKYQEEIKSAIIPLSGNKSLTINKYMHSLLFSSRCCILSNSMETHCLIICFVIVVNSLLWTCFQAVAPYSKFLVL